MLPAYRAEKDARRDALQAMRAKMRDLMEAGKAFPSSPRAGRSPYQP